MENPKDQTSSPLMPMLVVMLLLVGGLALQQGGLRLMPPQQPLEEMYLPPLLVDGWLNHDGPLDETSLEGKLVALDAWGLSCPPCLAAMPEMIALNRKYSVHKDFVLIGVTSDPYQYASADLPALKKYVGIMDGLDWPIGYGAVPVMESLGIAQLPTLILFNREGKAVWRGWDVKGLDRAIETAL